MTPELILQGLTYWQEQDYFGAHQAWEDYWHTIRKDSSRKLEADHVKGMIQVAVALVHKERGNDRWYRKLSKSGPELLLETGKLYEPVDPQMLIDAL